ncbi:MAG: formate--phosphoribosylaminoimidazolecarboxamide ligase family protein [Thermoplasmata archaeon]
MLPRSQAQELLNEYSSDVTVGTVGSHSALDIADGAATEGLPTLVLAQAGRERTYAQYFRAIRDPTGRLMRGCVDEVWTYAKFSEILAPAEQERLRRKNVLLIPNRALSSYVSIEGLENELRVPLVGSRALLRIEERGERDNYYTLLRHARIPAPEHISTPQEIDGLVIVKLPHASRRLERGFFTAASFDEYERKIARLSAEGVIDPRDLAAARIERYILGPVFNFNFFASPIAPAPEALELLGVDERRESSLDGLVRLPAAQQMELPESSRIPRYTVVGHGTLTVRESLLEEAFQLGERFVTAAREHYPPGILGPFCLQTCVDADGHLTVFDVAVRIGGGTNIHLALGHPYGNALWRMPMSTGRRLAVEIRRAMEEDRLKELVT